MQHEDLILSKKNIDGWSIQSTFPVGRSSGAFQSGPEKDKLIVCPGFRLIINILVTVPRAQEACVCNSSVSAAVRPVRHLLDTLPVPTTLVILWKLSAENIMVNPRQFGMFVHTLSIVTCLEQSKVGLPLVSNDFATGETADWNDHLSQPLKAINQILWPGLT